MRYKLQGVGIFLGLVLLFASPVRHFALEVPLQLRWSSLNTYSYTPAQPEKELGWNEYYRLAITIDSLAYKNLLLDMDIRNRADFVKNNLELSKAELEYSQAPWHLYAMTLPVGYGEVDKLAPSSLVSTAEDTHLFQPTRFNGIAIAYDSNLRISASLGGNTHNQGIGKLQFSLPVGSLPVRTCLSQEIRTLESHWRKPVYISAFSGNMDGEFIQLSVTGALAYFHRYDGFDSHSIPFVHLESRGDLWQNATLYISGTSLQTEPARFTKNEADISLSQRIDPFVISLGNTFSSLDNISLWKPHLLTEWRPAVGQRIGIYYQLVKLQNTKAQHIIGVQAELHYGL